MEARECRQSWLGRHLTNRSHIGNVGQRSFASERLDCWSEGRRPDRCPSMRHPFERVGYFCVDKDSTPKKLVFNRTVTLRDTWAKIEKAMKHEFTR